MSTLIETPDVVVAAPTVLFVDLDDTLIKTDLLAESVVKAAKNHPLGLLRALCSLTKGRAAFKDAMAGIVTPDVTHLPYQTEVLNLLEQQHNDGVTLVLATASPRPWADAIAAHLEIFDAVLASDDGRNLKGSRKLEAIQAYCQQEHHDSWAYVGDSEADLPIFSESDRAYLVSRSRRLQAKANRVASGRLTVLSQSRTTWKDVAKALRPHQWAKNILVFVPMILAHAFAAPQILATLLAWVCFSCVASSVYILNDMLDVETDRRHPRKCRRPFASGKLPLLVGPLMATSLLGIGITVAATALPVRFLLLLCGYWCLTTLYSVWLKHKLILDVMVLAGLYTLRVIAGGAAVNLPVTEWLMAFSMFLFTSLAFAKRYAELTRLLDESVAAGAKPVIDEIASSPESTLKPFGRSYRLEDIGMIESIGPTSGYLAVLVMALYINSTQGTALYRNGWTLWYICPVLMYWITRLWIIAKRRRLSEDPVVFALKDRVSHLLGLVVAGLLYVAVVL
ncbi:MAG: UbiA family prenyltransferase [Planctomycetota bacterium]